MQKPTRVLNQDTQVDRQGIELWRLDPVNWSTRSVPLLRVHRGGSAAAIQGRETLIGPRPERLGVTPEAKYRQLEFITRPEGSVHLQDTR